MTLIPVPRTAVIVVAAGSGTRLGAGTPKAFVAIDEETVLAHALRGVFAVQPAVQVIVVAPAGHEGIARTVAERIGADRASMVSVVTGGASRQESVAAGLAALWADIEVVLVHDAARALTPVDVFDRVIAAVDRIGWGILPVLPVVDTLKRVDGDRVTGLVDRSELAAAQTPQGFRRDVLETAYRVAETDYTDDAALVQAAGHEIGTVAGSDLSFKITTPADLDRARGLVLGGSDVAVPDPDAAAARPVASVILPRVGVGTDVHAFADEGTLWLAGLEWPGETALAGHSDGDAVAHAIVDAVLAAAGLGDIGTHFGVARPEFAGAHADAFLGETRRLVEDAGFRIGNVSVQVQAARPRFSGRREESERLLTAALGAPVSVSATTTDGLGFVGDRAGVQAFAVALVFPAG